MKARPKAVAGYLIGWTLVVFFVVLLTFIFSFLGTIICAALAGMMMGAAQLPRKQSFALSLLFPGVIFGILRASRAELSANQILLLAVLCFGLFWIIYAAIAALVSQEKTNLPRVNSQLAASAQARDGGPTEATQKPFIFLAPAEAPGSAGRYRSPADQALRLEVLEGTWLAQEADLLNQGRQRRMEIKAESLVLSITNGNGELSSISHAALKLSPGPTLTLGVSWIGLDPDAEVSI
jgi:hypothetical protein